MISEEYDVENPYKEEWFKLCKKRIQVAKAFYSNGTYPHRSFSPQVVKYIFELANELGMDNKVKYKVVELYDRYLSEMFIREYKIDYITHQNDWQNVLMQCKKQSHLRVMSCMQLISKYTSESSMLKLNDVEAVLKCKGHVYSRKEIVLSEARVFQTIGYKLNEPSLLTIVEFFINVIPFRITEIVYLTCLVLIDFVYIHQQELYDKLQILNTGHRTNTYIEKLEVLDIEYDKISTAAAVVVTAFNILHSPNEEISKDICEYLSHLCEKSADHLITLSSILISIINSI